MARLNLNIHLKEYKDESTKEDETIVQNEKFSHHEEPSREKLRSVFLQLKTVDSMLANAYETKDVSLFILNGNNPEVASERGWKIGNRAGAYKISSPSSSLRFNVQL